MKDRRIKDRRIKDRRIKDRRIEDRRIEDRRIEDRRIEDRRATPQPIAVKSFVERALSGRALSASATELQRSSERGPALAGTGCAGCKDGMEQPFPFSMAFQPIIDVVAERVYGYEALVRGPQGESAYSVLAQVTDENRYSFDQGCRVKAITLATRLGLVETGARLSINFMPGAVYSPAACIQLTLKTANEVGFPTDRLTFEITEDEQVKDRAHLRAIVDDYKKRGFKVALDDFGAGYSGLNLLADVPTDVLKVDIGLVRDIDRRPAALAIVETIVLLARKLGCDLIAEGIERVEEYQMLRDCGINLMQGYLFAKPQFEALPGFEMPRSCEVMKASHGIYATESKLPVAI